MGNIHAMNVCEEYAATESNVTPQTRFLPKGSDPRSPSEGIDRTPIEVICTPKERPALQGTVLKFETPNKKDDGVEQSEEAMETSLTESEKSISISKTDKKPYLETDIDAVDEVFSFTSGALQHPRVKELRTKTLTETKSSDILQMDSLSSRIDSVSFNDVSIDDPSVIVSDCEEGFEKDSKPVHDWLLTLEDERLSFESFEEAIQKETVKGSEKSTPVKEAISDVESKDSFYTPDSKKSLLNEKVRRPLSCLTQNKISEPIKNGLKATKIWRGIQEERERRGLSLGDENTPPLLPPVDKVSSAPGKLIRRRHIVDWDPESTMLI